MKRQIPADRLITRYLYSHLKAGTNAYYLNKELKMLKPLSDPVVHYSYLLYGINSTMRECMSWVLHLDNILPWKSWDDNVLPALLPVSAVSLQFLNIPEIADFDEDVDYKYSNYFNSWHEICDLLRNAFASNPVSYQHFHLIPVDE